MIQLEKNIWLGNAIELRNPKLLYANAIKCVVDVAYEEPAAQLPRDIFYLRFPLLDGEGNSPSPLRLALNATIQLIQEDEPFVVGCSAGMSRSPTLLSFVIAHCTGVSAEVVIERISAKRQLEIKPNLWNDFLAASEQLN